jgi:hypothetical protein
MLGLPVLTYNNEDVLEPVSINYKGNNILEYLNQIDILLEQRFDVERIRKAYRWRALEQVYSHVSIAESFKEQDDFLDFGEKLIKKFCRIINKVFPLRQQKKDIMRRSNELKNANIINDLIVLDSGNISNVIHFSEYQLVNENIEMDLIRSEMKRVMGCLYSNNKKLGKQNTLRSHLESFINSNS